jgi:phosphoesterase RecJ-like protein
MNLDTNFVNVNQAAEFFKKRDNFTIICHVNPDGDTLGSGYALCGALRIMGKYARLICDDVPSARFDYLKTQSDLPPPDCPETTVSVDVADLDLIGSVAQRYPVIDMCIDHHISNTGFAVMTLLDTQAASCAEVMWDLIKELVSKQLKSAGEAATKIAAAIYTGVSTDTGCFKYSNTTSKSHLIAAELMEYGFDFRSINYVMFEMKTRERVVLEQQAFAGIEYYFDGKCAVIVLTDEMLKGIDPEDASNVSALPKQIEGVAAGVVIKAKVRGANSLEKSWKISVRSNLHINAQAVCSAFGGGGHIRAAGCTLTGSLDSVKKLILDEIQKQI